MHVEDLPPAVFFGRRNLDNLFKPPRPQHGRIHPVEPIGGPQHQHALEFLDAIHFGQQLAEHALGHLRVAPTAAPRAGTSESISSKKMMHGAACLRLAKDLAHGLLGLAHVFRQQRRPLHRR